MEDLAGAIFQYGGTVIMAALFVLNKLLQRV